VNKRPLEAKEGSEAKRNGPSAMNDMPVACQNARVTEPQREAVLIKHAVSARRRHAREQPCAARLLASRSGMFLAGWGAAAVLQACLTQAKSSGSEAAGSNSPWPYLALRAIHLVQSLGLY